MRKKNTTSLTESRLRGMIREAIKSVLNEENNNFNSEEKTYPVADLKKLVCIMQNILNEYIDDVKSATSEWFKDHPEDAVLNNPEFVCSNGFFDTEFGTVECRTESCYGADYRCYFPKSWQSLGFKNVVCDRDGFKIKVKSKYAETTCVLAGFGDLVYSRHYYDEA